MFINKINFDPKNDPDCSVFFIDVHGYKWRLIETYNHLIPVTIVKEAAPEETNDIREYPEVQGVDE